MSVMMDNQWGGGPVAGDHDDHDDHGNRDNFDEHDEHAGNDGLSVGWWSNGW